MSFTVRDSCRLCDAKLPDERVLDLGETPLANALLTEQNAKYYEGIAAFREQTDAKPEFAAPLYLKQCSACGHVQLPVVVDPKLLFPADYPYASSTGESMRAHLRTMAEDLTLGMDENALAVEIGSNDGYLLSHLRDRGMRAVGIDPAAKLASSATHDGSLTIPEFFNVPTAHAVRNACGPAQLIVANNVFAHADDLHEIVEGVKVLLAPEGRFVFEVGYLPDVLAANNFGTVYHEHLSYHGLRPLFQFFSGHGLLMSHAQRVPTQGGSVRCFVSKAKGALTDGLLALIHSEAFAPDLLSTWQSRVDYAASAFASELTRLKMAGKTIAAYGCSAKSTTLLHVAGIGRETIDFICDDAPTKQGKFSPGKHIPIVPGSWLEEKQPDYCVSLSGNFSEAFKAEHPGFKGGWIEPDLAGGGT